MRNDITALLNGLTAEHLDFYYEQVLGLKKRPAKPGIHFWPKLRTKPMRRLSPLDTMPTTKQKRF